MQALINICSNINDEVGHTLYFGNVTYTILVNTVVHLNTITAVLINSNVYSLMSTIFVMKQYNQMILTHYKTKENGRQNFFGRMIISAIFFHNTIQFLQYNRDK